MGIYVYGELTSDNIETMALDEFLTWCLSGAKKTYECNSPENAPTWEKLSDDEKMQLLAHEIMSLNDNAYTYKESRNQVKAIINEYVVFNNQLFRIGDRVKLTMVNGFVRGRDPIGHRYIGTITSIHDDSIGMQYNDGQYNYLTSGMNELNKPYNCSGFFFLKDIRSIEKV